MGAAGRIRISPPVRPCARDRAQPPAQHPVQARLAAMKHVRLHTPRNPQLSSGIILLEVDAMSPDAAVACLLERRVVASALPYAKSYLRLAPSLVNSPADVDAALIAVRSLARS